MIQLQKTTTAPASLATKNKYDGEDVKALLAKDHYDKCYICERQLTTDFQVEHLHSQEHYPDEKYNWENLFFACSYCNGKKSANFDGIVNPTKEAIEERFFEEFLSKMNNFEKAVNDYLSAPTSETKEVVRELLSIEQEFLGFKYWIIKNNPTLFREFSNNIIWNK